MRKTLKRVLAVTLSSVMAASAFSITASAYNKNYQSETHDVFRHTEQTLAPGVEYYNNYAYLKDGEQVVYYAAVADINRDDVLVQGGYWNAQTEQYGMSKLTEQAASATAKFADPSDPDFISENYTVVAGTNGDFYNMQTGRPSGAFSINGKVMNGANNRPWFGIFEDGTALCGANDADYNAAIAAHGAVQNSVGGSQMLVVDGADVTANASGSYNTDRHSRTMIGVTADNKVVSIVVDGRQSPFSDGGSMHELAQIMIEADCVTAINLDGGGSTTFGARPEGEDSFKVINRPSDGSERSISSGVLIVSLAAPSNAFDHVSMSVADEYVTPGTSTTFETAGVSASGSSAEIPDEVTYEVTNGSVSNGVFTAGNAAGDAVITAKYNGNVVGSTTVHVVIPDTVEFEQATFTVPFGKTVPLPIVAKYGLNKVVTKPGDFNYVLETAEGAGVIADGAIIAPAEDSNATANVITATMIADETKTTTANIVFGKASQVIFDFEDGTTQNWVRYNTSNYNYIHTRGTASNVTAENGQVHSGEHALKVTANFSDTWEAGYVSGRLGVSGLPEVIDLKGATRLGMWVYLPVELKSFNGRIFMCKVTERDPETGAITKYDGYYTDTKIDKGGDWNCGFITQYEEPGWHYIYFDLSSDSDWCIIKNATLLDFYINDRNGDSYGYNHLDYKSQNPDLIFYLDDVTVDYSSVVEDRERPVFSSVLLGDRGDHSNEGLVLTNGYVSDGYDELQLSARVADDTTKNNYSGLNADSAKVFIDGIEFPCTYANGIITAPDYTFTNGQHTVKFAISDNTGNYASTSRTFSVANTAKQQPVKLVPHDDSIDRILLGSLYYVDVVAENAEKVNTVTVDLDLNNISRWELDHMEAADGFKASYEMVNEDEKIARVTITSTGDVNVAGEQALVSIPVRTWELPAVVADYGHAGVVWMYDKYKAGNEVWPVDVSVKVAAGKVTFTDGTDEIFTGEGVQVDTESIYWDNDNAKASDPYYKNWNGGHDHRAETAQYYGANSTNHVDAVAVPDIAPTCTEDGLTGRTYCEVCHSVVDWGTVVPATGHHYEFADGVLKCKDCEDLFNGIYDEDGKMYANGVPANDWIDEKYYIDGEMVKDAAYIIDGKTYVFDENGNVTDDSLDSYAGVVYNLDDNGMYFAVFGEYKTGWQTRGNDYYYFSPTDNKAVDGAQVINGINYKFENYTLVEGSWVERSDGWQYMWAGRGHVAGWDTIDGKVYLFNGNGYAKTGIQNKPHFDEVSGEKSFVFDDHGAWLGEDYTGLYDIGDDTYYVENGFSVGGGLRKIGDDYYYFKSNMTAVKNTTYFISITNDLLPAGNYTFDENGVLTVPGPEPEPETKNGFVTEDDGVTYYYVNGVNTSAGLIQIDGQYYYVKSGGKRVENCTYFISNTNGLLPAGNYAFDENGVMTVPGPEPEPETKNGFVTEDDGITYYYVNGVNTSAGLIQIDGQYYYVKSGGKRVENCTYFISNTNGLLPAGNYAFDENGVMTVPGPEPEPEVKNGFVTEDDGVTYYYVNGVNTSAGLIQIDGKYYYVKSGGKRVENCTYFISNTNGLLPAGNYVFDENGVLQEN